MTKGAATVDSTREWRVVKNSKECAQISERIRSLKAALDAAYEDRRGIFQALLDDGVQRKDIAAIAGIEPMTVTYALREKSATPPA